MPALPIHRLQPDDPDHENTLATAVFRVGGKLVRRLVDAGDQVHHVTYR